MRKLTLLFLATIFSIVAANAQGGARVFGYLPDYRDPAKIDFTRVTDIGYCFMNPDINGNIITSRGTTVFGWNAARFTSVLLKADQNDVDVWITVGGQDDAEAREKRLYDVCKNSSSRTKFAEQLLDYADEKGCKGVIIDWEFPKNTAHANATTYHKNLLEKLQAYDTQKGYGLKIGIAVGGEYTQTINHTQYVDPTLFNTSSNLVDEWHIMAYDFPNVAAYDKNHSSLKDGKKSIDKWIEKGVPAAKSLLAVPFYARDEARNAKAFNELPDNAFDSDSYVSGGKTWYYNGEATIRAKTTHALSKGAAGMVIWDLGQDKTGTKSLLTALKGQIDSECAIPQPSLGPDLGICDGQSAELDSDVPVGAYSFTWKKDGAVINGQDGPTLTATAGGEYQVVVTETGGGCSKDDKVKIISGSSVTTQDWIGCRDQDATISINNPAAGKEYDWYDAAVGGNFIQAGPSYTFTPNVDNDGGKTFTYYVEERSAETVNKSLLDPSVDDNFGWSANARAILIDAEKDLTIKSVQVHTQAGADTKITVKLLSTDVDDGVNAVLQTSEVFTIPSINGQGWEQQPSVLNLDMTVAKGQYFLEISASSGDFAIEYSGAYERADEAGTISVADHFFTNFSNGYLLAQQDEDGDGYEGKGGFYDLKVAVGASTSCGRATATAKIETCLNFADLESVYGVSVLPNPSSDAFTFSRGSLSGDVQLNVLSTSGELLFSESVSRDRKSVV